MEKNLREEIRLDFMSDLNKKGTLIQKQKDDFKDFRTNVNNELNDEIANQINDLDQLVRVKMGGGNIQSLHNQSEKKSKQLGTNDPELYSEIKYLTDCLRK